MKTACEKALRLLHETGQPQLVYAEGEERYRYLQVTYGRIGEPCPLWVGTQLLACLHGKGLLTDDEFGDLCFTARNRRALAKRSRLR